MKKRVLIVVFTTIAAVLAMVLILRLILVKPENQYSKAKLVTPQVTGKENKDYEESYSSTEEFELSTFVPLNSNETLLGVVSIDFDGDNLEDQVCAVKVSEDPFINLVIGIYNNKRNEYERASVIQTKVTQYKTFSFTGIDLSGYHKNALVYQGITDAGKSVFCAYHIYRSAAKTSVVQIADFEADGTIFVQQIDRYDSYDRLNSNGAPFPIWVYTTDTDPWANGTDQLQICYEWSSGDGKYVKASQIRVPGSKVSAKELARIQDGTVKTLAGHLKGLWKKSVDSGSSVHYISFDYENEEINFMIDDIVEVYKWQNSSLRRNGVNIATTNQEITNLQRRVDISLLGLDRIRVGVVDDIRMIIEEGNAWTGEYVRVNYEPPKETVLNKNSLSFVKDLEKGPSWKSADGAVLVFRDGQYTVNSDMVSDSGIYTYIDADDMCFIQLKSAKAGAYFTGSSYRISYAELPQSENASRSKRRKVQYNYDSIVLEPYVLAPEGSYSAEGRTVVLTRGSD